MERGLSILRHSCAHLLAQAVKELWPQTKLGIGPAIEEGFYYDFDCPQSFTPEDLKKIEERMREIVSRDVKFERMELSKKEAIRLFKKLKEIYKIELIDEIENEKATLYKQGEFLDLCRGPHVESTGKLKAFKLTGIAGAYWRGNEKNKMFQRIYGTAFPTQQELERYLEVLEEAKRRDHRKLGKELALFNIEDDVGAGLVSWYPQGARLRTVIEDFWRKTHSERGYEPVYLPHIAKIGLWQTSGHLEYYQDYIYPPIDIEGQKYILKPMNCPGHILIYKSRVRSYRELPIRFAELGTVYRYERSGVLHGLMRVRGFTQDDAHIFCRSDQLETEIVGVIDLAKFMLGTFGFHDYEIYLSTMPAKHVGTREDWDKAEGALKRALSTCRLDYRVDPGEGVFYGPKIDIKIKDSLGRSWQCSTIQVDFNLPARFGMRFVGEDGKESCPIMIHRALLGSLERFMGVLVEHYAGSFPVWLAPVQAIILPIADRHNDYARQIIRQFIDAGLRVDIDSRNERIERKIRDAELAKIPYMLVVGDKERQARSVSVRKRRLGDQGIKPVAEFVKELIEEVHEKNKKG
jgi:threonyl-tRNA synthetase